MPTNRLVSVSFHFPSKSMKTQFSFSGAGLPGMPTPGSWRCPVIISGCHSPLGIRVGAPTANVHKRHGDLHSKAYFPTVFHFLSEFTTITCVIHLWATKYGLPGGSAVKNPPANAGDTGSTPGSEDPLEKEMATHSRILARRIPRTEEPGRLPSMGLQRVRHD